MTRKSLAITLTALALSGCAFFRIVRSTKIKTPSFSYVACRFLGASDRQTDLEFTLASFNPNTIGLKNVSVSYELFYEDKRFLNGGDIAVELKPGDTTRIVVPASVVYREIFAVAGPVAQRLLLNRKTIPVRIDAVISGKPTVYNEVEEGALFQFSLKVSRTEEVPIPEDSADKAKRAVKGALRKLF
ncbi:MAG: hypothetical protein JWO30_3536 [Fibrobacteres bacterium]|nr:hypothetical protein [Fibrobacterota bacterium]